MTHPGLRGEMHHLRKAVRREQCCEARAVSQVALLEAKRGKCRKLVEPSALQRRIVIGVEVVESEDRAAPLQQASRDVIPDESCRPGDQDGIVGGAHCVLWRISRGKVSGETFSGKRGWQAPYPQLLNAIDRYPGPTTATCSGSGSLPSLRLMRNICCLRVPLFHEPGRRVLRLSVYARGKLACARARGLRA